MLLKRPRTQGQIACILLLTNVMAQDALRLGPKTVDVYETSAAEGVQRQIQIACVMN